MQLQETIFNLQNVKCAGCVSKIQSKICSLVGITDAKVNLLDKTMLVIYTNEKLDQQVIDAVNGIGYGASLEEITEKSVDLWIDIILPIILAIGLMTITMSSILKTDFHTEGGFAIGLFYAGFSLTMLLVTGRKIIHSGYLGFKTMAFNMHSLILLGVGAAWVYSLLVVLMSYYSDYHVMQHVYFDSSLMIIGLINLGAYLEDHAKSSTTKAIKGLANLVPETTTILVNNEEQTLATNLLRTDYLVKIRPGQQIPADGEIISGDGYINESMLTGESLPLHKISGDKVIGGAINTSGSFVFRVTEIGDNTLLAGIINLVKNAQLSKPTLAKLADNIARFFVPVIILIALISATIWFFVIPNERIYHAITVFMTVLLIACPCSVGLAIPVSLMVGVGRGASKGILIRDPSCLSIADKIDTVVLDKTGTITIGKPAVVNAIFVSENTHESVLQKIAILESSSEHPLAAAILAYSGAVTNDLQITEFQSISGCGVSAYIDSELYYAGSKDWMLQLQLSDNELLIDNIYSQIYLANATQIIARFDIADQTKPESLEAINNLKRLGLQVIMLTGDNQVAAMEIAKQVAINDVYANCKPADKIAKIRELQSQGNHVVFVGDGINDAPSLAAADIGIAIGSGTDIARQSAAISLMRDSLSGVSDSILLARQINKNMRQNLFGSFIYNIIAVLVAAGVLYPTFGVLLNPMIASVVMSLSSVSVIGNSLRLRFA